MSGRELRAEARAWRRAAVLIDACAQGVAGLHTGVQTVADCDTRLYRGMKRRLFAHTREVGVLLPLWDDRGQTVLACLFLALECEDEARALGRGAR